jgi:beta-mannosidase
MDHHTKDNPKNKIDMLLESVTGVAEDLDEFVDFSMIAQAEALKFGIEHFRRRAPHCSGTIVWQLNDCWPVISWSAIDGRGRLKPLYFALRQAYANRALTLQPRDGGLAAVVLNDDDRPWSGRLTVRCLDLTGAVLGTAGQTVLAAPRSAVPCPVSQDPAAAVVVAELDGVRALWFPAEDLDLRFPDPELEVRVEAVAGGLDVHVRALRLARDILIQPDRIHPSATVDQGFVTLLGGEQTLFRVRCPVPLDPSLAGRPWVITDLHSALARS